MLSRRHLLAAAAAGLALPLLGSGLGASKRRMIVLHVVGGWDPTWVFTDVLNHPSFYFDPTASTAEGAAGLPFIDSPQRPAVRSFFERWGAQTAVINGMRIRGLTHPAAHRLLMTDSNAPEAAGWASHIAADSPELELPQLVSSGGVFPGPHGALVTRLGEQGQLISLLDGSALQGSEMPVQPLGPSASDAVDAYLAERGLAQGDGVFEQDYVRSLDRVAQLSRLQETLDLQVEYSEDMSVAQRLAPALDCLQAGLTRVVSARHLGFRSGWDHHSGIEQQIGHYQILFTDLLEILDSLSQRPGLEGGSLLDETTVVVCSEMGRAPILNGAGGKDHWVYTTAMLIGSGVRGGQVYGSYNEDFEGQAIDLVSGAPDPSGTLFDSGNLGATLCELMGVTPPEQINGKRPLEALLA